MLLAVPTFDLPSFVVIGLKGDHLCSNKKKPSEAVCRNFIIEDAGICVSFVTHEFDCKAK